MKKTITIEIVDFIILGVVLNVLILGGIWFNNKIKLEREQNQRVEKSLIEAHEIEKEEFCKRYMKYTEPQEAPYAYRYCWNK